MVSYLDCSIIVCKVCKRAEFGYFNMGVHISRCHPNQNLGIDYVIPYPKKIKGS